MARVRGEGRICTVPHEPALPVNTFWDLGFNDTTAIWFHQRVGRENRFIDYVEGAGEGLAHYAQALGARPYNDGAPYLPHDVEVGELGTGRTRRRRREELAVRPSLPRPR